MIEDIGRRRHYGSPLRPLPERGLTRPVRVRDPKRGQFGERRLRLVLLEQTPPAHDVGSGRRKPARGGGGARPVALAQFRKGSLELLLLGRIENAGSGRNGDEQGQGQEERSQGHGHSGRRLDAGLGGTLNPAERFTHWVPVRMLLSLRTAPPMQFANAKRENDVPRLNRGASDTVPRRRCRRDGSRRARRLAHRRWDARRGSGRHDR